MSETSPPAGTPEVPEAPGAPTPGSRRGLIIGLSVAGGVLLVAVVVLLVLLLAGGKPLPVPTPSPTGSTHPTPSPTPSPSPTKSPTPTPSPTASPTTPPAAATIQSFTAAPLSITCSDGGATPNIAFGWATTNATQVAIAWGTAQKDAISTPNFNGLPATAQNFQVPYDCAAASLVYSLTVAGPDAAHVTKVVTVTRATIPPTPPPDHNPQIMAFAAQPVVCPSHDGTVPLVVSWSIKNFSPYDDNVLEAIYVDGDKGTLGDLLVADGSNAQFGDYAPTDDTDLAYDCSLDSQVYAIALSHNGAQVDFQDITVRPTYAP